MMALTDDTIFERVLRVENKDIFVDLKKNKNGTYLKISERNGRNRSTVLNLLFNISLYDF